MAVVDDVIIGVDPHKLSATIEVVNRRGLLVGSGRFSTDRAGYVEMRRYVAVAEEVVGGRRLRRCGPAVGAAAARGWGAVAELCADGRLDGDVAARRGACGYLRGARSLDRLALVEVLPQWLRSSHEIVAARVRSPTRTHARALRRWEPR